MENHAVAELNIVRSRPRWRPPIATRQLWILLPVPLEDLDEGHVNWLAGVLFSRVKM